MRQFIQKINLNIAPIVEGQQAMIDFYLDQKSFWFEDKIKNHQNQFQKNYFQKGMLIDANLFGQVDINDVDDFYIKKTLAGMIHVHSFLDVIILFHNLYRPFPGAAGETDFAKFNWMCVLEGVLIKVGLFQGQICFYYDQQPELLEMVQIIQLNKK